MSRVGKYPVIVPDSVKVELSANAAMISGKNGNLSVALSPLVTVSQEGNAIHVTPTALQKRNRIMWGTVRANLNNAVQGIANKFEKRLELQGVGYRVRLEGNALVLSLGFSHDVNFPLPEGISAVIEGDRKNVLVISGIDKQKVGEVASSIRRLRPPEPYRGKGVRYFGEELLRKEGKKK